MLYEVITTFLQRELKQMRSRHIRFNVIGEVDRLPAKIRAIIEKTICETASNQAMTLTLALSYGARNELTRAARHLAEQAASGVLDPAKIDEDCLANALDTAGIPDPRITSYNVCYTKLLRGASAPGQPAAQAARGYVGQSEPP